MGCYPQVAQAQGLANDRDGARAHRAARDEGLARSLPEANLLRPGMRRRSDRWRCRHAPAGIASELRSGKPRRVVQESPQALALHLSETHRPGALLVLVKQPELLRRETAVENIQIGLIVVGD
jgi:hypothetical protein